MDSFAARWREVSRVIAALSALLVAGCVVDPFGASARHVRHAKTSAERGDFSTAYAELHEANELAEDDPELLRDLALAQHDVERAKTKYLAETLDVAGTPETLATAWELRSANARAGGTSDTDALLVTKMKHSLGLLLQMLEKEVAAGKTTRAAAILPELPTYPGVSDEVVAPKRIAALAATAAARHVERASALAKTGRHPLAQRAHIGLAAIYVGGTVPDASALVAPTRVAISVQPRAASGCQPVADAMAKRFTRPGEGRQIELEIDVATCAAQETSSPAVEDVTWEIQVPYKKWITRTEMECEPTAIPETSRTCRTESAPGANIGYTVCSTETFTRWQTLCTPKTVSYEITAFRAERASGKRAVMKLRTVVELAGSFVLRRADQPAALHPFRLQVERSDITYPAVGTLPAKERSPDTTADRVLASARDNVEQAIAAAVAALLENDRAVARSAVADASAAGDLDREEEAIVRLILLGEPSAGALATRYGTTVAAVQEAFGATSFPGWAGATTTMTLPARETIPELDAAQREEVKRRRRTGLPPPLTARGWFTFGAGGFVTDSATTPTSAELLGYGGLELTTRFGASLLGRWRRDAYGVVLADDAVVRLDAGFPLARSADQLDGGTLLRVGGEYTLGVGARAHRRGGVLVGLRAIASYELMEGIAVASVPWFGRIEVPLPTGSLCVEAYGRPLAGTSVAGGALYLTAETLRRHDTSSQFIALRAERVKSDRTATYTDDAFNEMTETFTAVPATHVTIELGAAF